MAIKFDYSADTSTDAVASVADSIRSTHRLAPLTEEQKLQRRVEMEAFREEQAWQAEERKAERDRLEAQRAEAERAEAAIALAKANKKRRLELQERERERQRGRQITELHFRARQSELWQSNVDAAARHAVAVRQQQALLADVERHLTPPAPPPEPEVIYVEAVEGSDQLGTSDFNPKLWMQKPRSWW